MRRHFDHADNNGCRPESLVLLSHESFAAGVTEETFAGFTDETGIAVEVLAAGDAGATLNQAILTKESPLGDVLFGVDTTFLSRALAEDLFVPHEAASLADVPDDLQVDPSHRVTPIDFGDVCINYDKEGLSEAGLAPPAELADLTRPEYRGTLVVEHPATSSPGLAFLLATIAEFGEDGWTDFWVRLRDNDVAVTAGWDEAYYSSFSGGSGEGDRPLVVSYASSPPAEVIFSETPIDEAPTGVVTAGCYRQVEFAGVLREQATRGQRAVSSTSCSAPPSRSRSHSPGSSSRRTRQLSCHLSSPNTRSSPSRRRPSSPRPSSPTARCGLQSGRS